MTSLETRPVSSSLHEGHTVEILRPETTPADAASPEIGARTVDDITQIAMVDVLRTVHKIAQTLHRRWDRELRKHIPGMNAMRAVALVQLAQTDGTSQAQLARVLEVSHMSVTRLVDDLEQLGWAQRLSDPADRRAWAVHLTAAGRDKLAAIHAGERALYNRLTAKISVEHRIALAATLAKLKSV